MEILTLMSINLTIVLCGDIDPHVHKFDQCLEIFTLMSINLTSVLYGDIDSHVNKFNHCLVWRY